MSERDELRPVPLVPYSAALTLVRTGLGAALLAAAYLAGAERSPGAIGFALALGVSTLMLLTDRRSVLLGRPELELLPPGSSPGPLARAVLEGLFPSTVGVSALAAVSLAFEPVLSAVLAGVVAGMAAAGAIGTSRIVLWERRGRIRLYGESGRGRRLFSEPR